MEQTVSAIKLITWPGWGVVGAMTVLCALLAAILALLLPFPKRSLDEQLADTAGRVDIAARLGAVTIAESFLIAQRRFNAWLEEWFGPPFSAQAFERCLAIAFIYPVTVFLITLAINGLVTGRVSGGEFAGFLAVAAVLTGLAYLLLGLGIRVIRRLWVTLGGDADLAPVLARVALGMLAVITAFAIAFAIASVASINLNGAPSVMLAVLGAFALAFALALTFAFAGAKVFAAAVAAIAALVLVFASQFAFVLLLFFVIIPFVNACIDWLSWASTRSLTARAAALSRRHPQSSSTRLAMMGGALALSGVIALLLVFALTALLANSLEVLTALTALAGEQRFNWRPLVEKAVEAPWSEALFITAMVLTPLVPVALHIAIGVARVLARFTPGAGYWARSLRQTIPKGTEETVNRSVKRIVRLSRLWYLPAILAVLGVLAVLTLIANAAGVKIAVLLTHTAICATSWRHGLCF